MCVGEKQQRGEPKHSKKEDFRAWLWWPEPHVQKWRTPSLSRRFTRRSRGATRSHGRYRTWRSDALPRQLGLVPRSTSFVKSNEVTARLKPESCQTQDDKSSKRGREVRTVKDLSRTKARIGMARRRDRYCLTNRTAQPEAVQRAFSVVGARSTCNLLIQNADRLLTASQSQLCRLSRRLREGVLASLTAARMPNG